MSERVRRMLRTAGWLIVLAVLGLRTGRAATPNFVIFLPDNRGGG